MAPKTKSAKRSAAAAKKSRLKVEYVPIAQIKPFKGNPRKNADAVPEIVRSIEHMEIKPKYCDVIVERWQQFTGGKAKRIIGKQTTRAAGAAKKRKKKSA